MMTKEQAYAALGQFLVAYDRALCRHGYQKEDMEIFTGLIAGMTGVVDEMDRLGAFDTADQEPSPYRNKDHIWWRDAEEVMPEAGSSVLIWNWNLLTDRCSIERGCWNGNLWISEPYDGEGIKNVLYWAPFNPPEGQS